jgi:hypothetical protein
LRHQHRASGLAYSLSRDTGVVRSFANPAVTLARTLSDTFAGIAPSSVPEFVVAKAVGGLIACGAIRVLWPRVEAVAEDVVVPHEAVDGQRASASHQVL